MSRVSIELVPRNQQSLESELKTVKEQFPDISTVNIPDIMRFSIRSWDACVSAQDYVANTIPHIRSIDFSMQNPEEVVDLIAKCNLSEVLLVSGDPPQDLSRKVYRTSPTSLMRFLKREIPDLKIYAALDPYRYGLKTELDYINKKIDSGADGFFTQPFFDVSFMELYADQMQGLEIFWGASPVLGDRSRSYWENRNNAFFPSEFEPTMDWNRDFAKKALTFCRDRGHNIYFMPIRTGISEYLDGILN